MWQFKKDIPIYSQIVEQISQEIISGKRKPGDKIESVRELAALIKVNPNTIQKALSELEDKGLIYTLRNNGRYVSENEKLLKDTKNDLIKQKVNDFLSIMNKMNVDKETLIKMIKETGENE